MGIFVVFCLLLIQFLFKLIFYWDRNFRDRIFHFSLGPNIPGPIIPGPNVPALFQYTIKINVSFVTFIVESEP